MLQIVVDGEICINDAGHGGESIHRGLIANAQDVFCYCDQTTLAWLRNNQTYCRLVCGYSVEDQLLAALTSVRSSGDSYSSVGYDSRAPHPTPENPLGVEFPGITFTRTSEEPEPNWVGHLITEYCPRPSVLVYDYAVGGGTIHGVKHQIDYHFMRSLASKPDWAPWTGDDTLFGTSDMCWLCE